AGYVGGRPTKGGEDGEGELGEVPLSGQGVRLRRREPQEALGPPAPGRLPAVSEGRRAPGGLATLSRRGVREGGGGGRRAWRRGLRRSEQGGRHLRLVRGEIGPAEGQAARGGDGARRGGDQGAAARRERALLVRARGGPLQPGDLDRESARAGSRRQDQGSADPGDQAPGEACRRA